MTAKEHLELAEWWHKAHQVYINNTALWRQDRTTVSDMAQQSIMHSSLAIAKLLYQPVLDKEEALRDEQRRLDEEIESLEGYGHD